MVNHIFILNYIDNFFNERVREICCRVILLEIHCCVVQTDQYDFLLLSIIHVECRRFGSKL